MLAPPEVKEITKDQWERYDMEKKGALRVYDGGDGIYDFFVNVDNGHLLAEISSINDSEQIEMIKSQYKIGISLIGLATLHHYLGTEKEDDIEDLDMSKVVYDTTKIISPIFLPMIKSVGELSLDTTKA